jgi:hypothetical protein
VQNSSFYVKICLWILTTNFTKTAFVIKLFLSYSKIKKS